MKKTLVALAALAAASAFAQSTVTMSGSAQVGVMNTGAANTGTAAAHLGNGMNAINISSAEDMGGGLKAGFDSQIRFNIGTGDMNSSGNGNALFHNANVYLSDAKLGTIRAGKIAEVSNCGLDPWACGGGASMMAGEGLAAVTTVGASTNAGAVGYTSPTLAGFALTVTQAQQNNVSNQRNSALLSYTNGPLAAQYLEINGAANVAANGANSSAAYTAPTGAHNYQTSIGASYDLKVAKIMVTNNVAKNGTEQKVADNMTLGLTAPFGKYTLLAGYAKAKHLTNGTSVITSANDTKTSVGVNYSLSKRTTLGADVFKAEAVNASTGYVMRIRHTF